MIFINLTPHEIVVDGITYLPSGTVARLKEFRKRSENLEGHAVEYVTFEDVPDLPDPRPGIVYLVSALVLNHPDVQERLDVFAPGKLLRDARGNVIGCDGLACTRAYYLYHKHAKEW